MGSIKMHADEIETDVALVRRLLAGQFPQWADLRIVPVASYETDHDIYRLGDHLAARLPRIGWATKQAAMEAEWLPKLAEVDSQRDELQKALLEAQGRHQTIKQLEF